jgi:hypothetical protein
MKRFFLAASFAFCFAASLPAQQDLMSQPVLISAALPSAPPVAAQPNSPVTSSLSLSTAPSAASFAEPSASPAPQFPGSRDVDFYKWDLAFGYNFFHFKSAPFNANLSGEATDLTYNFRDWLGVEGNVATGWGGSVFSGEKAKSVLFTGGVHVSMGSTKHRWLPWGHALVGGLHMWPQTAGNGRMGFAAQLGGGADYRLNDRLSARVTGDYVRSQLYHDSQNNFQFGAGIVIHF